MREGAEFIVTKSFKRYGRKRRERGKREVGEGREKREGKEEGGISEREKDVKKYLTWL